MNFYNDILIPFMIGIFGIYFAYMLFDLLLDFSFGVASSIKDDLKKKKTTLGKWITFFIYFLVVPVAAIIVIGNIFGEEVLSKYNVLKIIFGLLGFAIFIAFLNSPLHKKFRNKDKT